MLKTCFRCKRYYPTNGDETRCHQMAYLITTLETQHKGKKETEVKEQHSGLADIETQAQRLAEKCDAFKFKDDWSNQDGYDTAGGEDEEL